MGKMSRHGQKGFTLIELLVVISIISLLASVTLASLNSARNRANVATIQANLANIRPQAELRLDTLGCYSNSSCSPTLPAQFLGSCPASGHTSIFGQSTIVSQIAAAKAAGYIDVCSSTTGGKEYAVVVSFKHDHRQAWCVDSSGSSKLLAEDPQSNEPTQQTWQARAPLGVCLTPP